MPFPDSPTTTGWLLACDFLFNGRLVPGGSIFSERSLAEQLYAAGAPVINYEPQSPGDPNVDPFLLAIQGYNSQRVRDPSVQLMPYLAPLIKNGFDQIFRLLQYRVGWFNGVGPWNTQMQWGGNQVFDDTTPLVLQLPVVPPPAPDQDSPLGARTQLYRPKPAAPSVTLQDPGGRLIGFDFPSAAASLDVSAFAQVELTLLQDPTQPWPTAFWLVTNTMPLPA